jgi:hypothetical protein
MKAVGGNPAFLSTNTHSGPLLPRPDGVLYSLKFGSIASRRRVPRLLFQSGLYPFFDTFPYLGDVCFRPCLGLFIHVQL